ncbi:MAG: septum formation protein Maf [Epulopiscium sp.]|nr:septum formation protein Maf [Candidatus Epulonipiscium sp.]
MDKIILASSSPRRRMLLRQIGIPFDIIVGSAEEKMEPSTLPWDLVIELSRQKAEDVARGLGKGYLVIGADTIVVHRNKILGKPKDMDDAYSMISVLQGDMHEVYTGITLIKTSDNIIKSGFEKTEVHMRELSPEIINAYIDTKEPMDKAGSYGIQGIGTLLIDKIHGDYNNVVGLPLKLLAALLGEIDIELFNYITFKSQECE